MLVDLGPLMKELFPATADKVQCELVESLKEEYMVGVFPTGAKWPLERTIDVVMKPELPASRLNMLVKS